MIFQWNGYNRRHVAQQGLTEYEAQEVVVAARSPFSRAIEVWKHLI